MYLMNSLADKPEKKKRGRKPKNNVIINDNPIFETTNNELIVKLQLTNLEKSFTNDIIHESDCNSLEVNNTSEILVYIFGYKYIYPFPAQSPSPGSLCGRPRAALFPAATGCCFLHSTAESSLPEKSNPIAIQ